MLTETLLKLFDLYFASFYSVLSPLWSLKIWKLHTLHYCDS